MKRVSEKKQMVATMLDALKKAGSGKAKKAGKKPTPTRAKKDSAKSRLTTFVVYTGLDEVLVTTVALERKMLTVWFTPSSGRDLENDYDREIFEGESCIRVCARLLVD